MRRSGLVQGSWLRRGRSRGASCREEVEYEVSDQVRLFERQSVAAVHGLEAHVDLLGSELREVAGDALAERRQQLVDPLQPRGGVAVVGLRASPGDDQERAAHLLIQG